MFACATYKAKVILFLFQALWVNAVEMLTNQTFKPLLAIPPSVITLCRRIKSKVHILQQIVLP